MSNYPNVDGQFLTLQKNDGINVVVERGLLFNIGTHLASWCSVYAHVWRFRRAASLTHLSAPYLLHGQEGE